MVRRKQPQVSPFRVYRQFAAVTIVVTAALAILVDGEKRAALAEEIDTHQKRKELEAASTERFGKPRLVKRDPQTAAGSFGSDSGTFGEPTDDTGGHGGGYVPDDFDESPRVSPASYNRFGLTDAQWAALSPEQREALERQARAEEAEADSALRRNQIEALRRASARRSGTGTASESED